MAILVRMKKDHGTIRKGEDAAVTPGEARSLQEEGLAWVVGGDPADFEAHGLVPDSEVGEAVEYSRGNTAEAEKG